MSSENLVAVIIPAYNAEATLQATVDSVRAQSYRALEIVIVDDGSTDGTPAIAAAAQAVDDRIRVIRTANGGVAKARNAGAAASSGKYLAPVDADDLWHPEKIARQLAIMRAGGPEMGLVYTLSRRIDENGRILRTVPAFAFVGHVFLRSLLHNFVGNGSALLMRRVAFERAGGYEPTLRDRGAEGTEDMLLQSLIARDWTVGVVPEALTGYRRIAGSMSENVERTERSHRMSLEFVAWHYPDTPADIVAVGIGASWARLAFHRLFVRREPLTAARAMASALRLAKAEGVSVVRHKAVQAFRLRRRRAHSRSPSLTREVTGLPFLEVDPAHGIPTPANHPLRSTIEAAARKEEAFARGARGAATRCSSGAWRSDAGGLARNEARQGPEPSAQVQKAVTP